MVKKYFMSDYSIFWNRFFPRFKNSVRAFSMFLLKIEWSKMSL